jgi:uncharacterized membrane protein
MMMRKSPETKRVLFDALLEPNRPLSPRMLLIILGAVAAFSFTAGVLFALRGAWPVTPFFGADVLILGIAFLICVRSARRRERLVLTHESLVIERLAPNGKTAREEVDPYWLKVEHKDPERIGCELALVSRGKRWIVGSFLGPDDKASLAEALREALYKVRNTLP